MITTHKADIQFLGPDSLIQYDKDTVAFIPHEEVDKVLATINGCPVIINGHVFTDEPAFKQDIVVGTINGASFDENSKAYVASVDLTDEGYDVLKRCQAVSIGYKANQIEYGERKINGGIGYNQIHRGLEFDHLLITENPRLYTSKVQFMNSGSKFINTYSSTTLLCSKENNIEGDTQMSKKVNEDMPVEVTVATDSVPAVAPVSTSDEVINQLLSTVNGLVSVLSSIEGKIDALTATVEGLKANTPAEEPVPVQEPAVAPAPIVVEPVDGPTFANSAKEKSFAERMNRSKKS